ncbi:MAG TPA: protein kinase, partial [Dongiaceae bacterium]|nr:protein kinase [Dongiaceae bacterium]
RDLRHGRSVAIKVLDPHLAERVGSEAFLNEMQVTAGLQHPLILSLHDSGSADGLLYYVMPFVEGETLRERLRREGQLSIPEAVRIGREVADALAYAHEKKIVHRDIKPENILLTGGHAMVADFGIARALQLAGDRTVRMGEGVSGTPAYMSPEQAMGEPGDARSDVYSLGCVLYEMLAGNPPFVEPTASALMKRVLVETPVPVRNHRSSVPEPLAQIIAQCLEKIPADRWGTAAELGGALSAVQDTQRTMTAVPSPSPGSGVPALRVAGLVIGFAAGSFLVLLLARALIRQLGLPDWVLPATVVVLALGLPVLLATLFIQSRFLRVTHVPGPHRWLTWRNAILGGGFAFLGLTLFVSGYMLSRKTGIGPGASLVSAGVLDERDRILIAEFENATPDSLLGATVKEALSVDLSQSPSVTIVPGSQIAEGLLRMQLDPKSPLKADLARELAIREGMKAVVTGELRTLGKGYVLSAKLVSPQSSEVLLAEREGAEGPEELIQAVDRLSKKLREHIGESLKSIRANKPLEQVTTSSLAALQKYTQAVYAAEMESDVDKAIALLGEAVKLDSTFAMAYRKEAVILSNVNRDPAETFRATLRAFELRNRLPDRERYLTEGQYYDLTGEPEKAVLAFQKILDMSPDDAWALNNLGVEYQALGQFEKSLEFMRRSDAVASSALTLGNIVSGEAELGRFADAERTLQEFTTKYPGNPQINQMRTFLSLAQGQYDVAESTFRAGLDAVRQSPFLYGRRLGGLALFMAQTGRLGEAERHARQASDVYANGGITESSVRPMLNLALVTLFVRNDPHRATAIVDAILAKTPLESLEPAERPFFELAYLYAMSGDPTRARALLAEYERSIDPLIRKTKEQFIHGALGAVLLAEHRPQEAIREFELDRAKQAFAQAIDLPLMARAYEMLNMPDSALVSYERFVTVPQFFRLREDAFYLGASLVRLGELYEARGDRTRAIEYYSRFVDLWKNADPDLQPRVRAVKAKVETLATGARS